MKHFFIKQITASVKLHFVGDFALFCNHIMLKGRYLINDNFLALFLQQKAK